MTSVNKNQNVLDLFKKAQESQGLESLNFNFDLSDDVRSRIESEHTGWARVIALSHANRVENGSLAIKFLDDLLGKLDGEKVSRAVLVKGKGKARTVGVKGTDDVYSILTDEDLTTSDVYFTPNFYSENARSFGNSTVNYLSSVYIDVDNINRDELNIRLEKSGLPTPTAIISTGRGFHVYYFLNFSPYIGKKSKDGGRTLAKWQSIQDDFIDRLGGDTSVKSPAQRLRLPDTHNQKSGTKAEIILYNRGLSYSLDYLYKCIPTSSPTLTSKKYKEHTAPKKVTDNQVKSSEYRKRTYYITQAISDLITLANIRGGIQEGSRNQFLLCLKALFITKDEIEAINRTYCKPAYPLQELDSLMSKPYTGKPMRIETMIDRLYITTEEQASLVIIRNGEFKDLREQLDYEMTSLRILAREYYDYLTHAYTLHSKQSDVIKADFLGVNVKTVRVNAKKPIRNLYSLDVDELNQYRSDLYKLGDKSIKPQPQIEILLHKLKVLIELDLSISRLLVGDTLADELINIQDTIRLLASTLESNIEIAVYNKKSKRYKLKEVEEQIISVNAILTKATL